MRLEDVIEAMRCLPCDAGIDETFGCFEAAQLSPGTIIRDLIAVLDETDVLTLVRRSKETSTHYVWVLAENPVTRAKLCVHQFKPSWAAAPGYANTIHNHRYDFTSLILSGGYLEESYEIPGDHVAGSRIDALPSPRRIQVTAGSIASVSRDLYHRVTHLAEGTLTLVVKGPPKTNYSMSVDFESKTVRIHQSLKAKVDELRVGLARVAEDYPGKS